MLIQVIHCHPLTDSYNHALFRTIVGSLERRGHQVIATDLYRESFQPAMTEQERRSYLGMDYDGHAVAGYIDTPSGSKASSSAFRTGGSRCLPSLEGVCRDRARARCRLQLQGRKLSSPIFATSSCLGAS